MVAIIQISDSDIQIHNIHNLKEKMKYKNTLYNITFKEEKVRTEVKGRRG